jgi:microcystin-dependent protein
MSSPFVAEIRIFACRFAPKGWAQCNGQLLPIAQNTALFSLLGTMYGGDGKSTFALPDMQGNFALGTGTSTTGTEYFEGQASGSQSVTLLQTEMPAHNHFLRAATQDNADVNLVSPTASWAASTGGTLYQDSANVQMNNQAIGFAGNGAPHNNMMPFQVLLFCIAMQGVFPPRG